MKNSGKHAGRFFFLFYFFFETVDMRNTDFFIFIVLYGPRGTKCEHFVHTYAAMIDRQYSQTSIGGLCFSMRRSALPGRTFAADEIKPIRLMPISLLKKAKKSQDLRNGFQLLPRHRRSLTPKPRTRERKPPVCVCVCA